MNVMRLPDEQFPAQDQDVQQRLPVEEIVEQVNAVLRTHGRAQLTSFSVMHRRFANCTCAEPSAVVSLQGLDARCHVSRLSATIPV